MATYEILKVNGENRWTSKKHGGEYIDYQLTIRNSEGKEATAFLTQKPETQAPAPGPFEGTVERVDYGPERSLTKLKLKKAPQNLSSGANGRRDPETQTRIERQHSQGCAIQLAQMAVPQALEGKTMDEVIMWADTYLRPLIDWFAADVGHKP